MKKLENLAEKVLKLIGGNQLFFTIGLFVLVYFLFAIMQIYAGFPDPDSFYHLKMAKLIWEQGLVFDFPWLQFTLLKEFYIDHHFLYHIVTIPFIELLGDMIGLKMATMVLATGFIILVYWMFKKFKLIYPPLFTLLLVFSPNVIFRLSLAKAIALSLILLFLGIYCIFKRKYWWLLLVSFFYVWTYGGFLILFFISLLYVLAQTIYLTFIKSKPLLEIFLAPIRKKKNLFFVFLRNLFLFEHIKVAGVTLIGLVLGLVINPYFPKNLYFYWQQVFEIGIKNYQGVVNVGREWYPYNFLDLLGSSGALIIFAVIALVLFVVFIKKQKPESIFFCLASLFFFFLTLKSKRYVEYYIPFLAFFTAFSLTFSLSGIKIKKFLIDLKEEAPLIGYLTRFVIILLIIFTPIVMVKDAFRAHYWIKKSFAIKAFQEPAKYLEEHTQPGEIIMHTCWSEFPILFYHNSHNYYIVGLDPTFMYNYDKALYKLYEDITLERKLDNLYNDIKDNFLASYFFVDKRKEKLIEALNKDEHFINVLENDDIILYKIY